MSSRLIPPKPGAIARTVAMISAGSWVERQIGQASMSAKRLKSNALPSMTGRAARGPMLPRPSTAEPSVTTATELPLTVRRPARDGSAAISSQGHATPGVYARVRSSWVSRGTREAMASLPRCAAWRARERL